jgi:hypothetical protein
VENAKLLSQVSSCQCQQVKIYLTFDWLHIVSFEIVKNLGVFVVDGSEAWSVIVRFQ